VATISQFSVVSVMSRDAIWAGQYGCEPFTSTAENNWRKTDMIVSGCAIRVGRIAVVVGQPPAHRPGK
jgi:hypothetical protein